MFLEKIVDGHVSGNVRPAFDFDSGASYVLDFPVEVGFGKPIFGDAIAQHSARFGHVFIDDRIVTLCTEKPCGS